MRALRALLMAACVLLLAGEAAGASAEGELLVQGALRFPAGTRITFTPTAMFLGDSTQLNAFSLDAARLRVLAMEEEHVAPAGATLAVVVDTRERSFLLDDARLELVVADHSGYLGLLAPASRALLEVDGRASVESHPASEMGQAPGSRPGPRVPSFQESFNEPHLRLSTRGVVEADGPMSIKIHGADVRIVARQNTSEFTTGIESTPGGYIRKWLVIETTDGILRLDTALPIEAATRSTQVAWNGAAAFDAASGKIDNDGRQYDLDGGAGRLAGDLQAAITPGFPATSARVVFEGIMSEAPSAQGEALVASGPSKVWPFILLIGLLGVGIMVGVRVARRPRPRVHDAEDALSLARIAADEGRAEDAVRWAREAVRMAPTSELATLELASHLVAAGQDAEALGTIVELEARSESGDASLAAAILLCEDLSRRAQAVGHLVEALTRSPLLVLEVTHDERLHAILQDARVERALRAARDHVEGEPF